MEELLEFVSCLKRVRLLNQLVDFSNYNILKLVHRIVHYGIAAYFIHQHLNYKWLVWNTMLQMIGIKNGVGCKGHQRSLPSSGI